MLPLSLAILTGCSSWRVQPASPAQAITEEHPAEIRLGRTDRQQVVLKRPVLRGDSIWGQTGKDSAGVPLDEITTIAVRRTDWLKTAGWVAVSTSAVLGVVCAATCDFGPTFTLRPEWSSDLEAREVPDDLRISCGRSPYRPHQLSLHLSGLWVGAARAERRPAPACGLHARVRRHPHPRSTRPV